MIHLIQTYSKWVLLTKVHSQTRSISNGLKAKFWRFQIVWVCDWPGVGDRLLLRLRKMSTPTSYEVNPSPVVTTAFAIDAPIPWYKPRIPWSRGMDRSCISLYYIGCLIVWVPTISNSVDNRDKLETLKTPMLEFEYCPNFFINLWSQNFWVVTFRHGISVYW